MRLLAAALMTLAGAILTIAYPLTVVVAVAICLSAAVLLGTAAWQNPEVASLRHAAFGSVAMFAVAGTVALLIVSVPGGLDAETREKARVLIIAGASFPALYWLILLGTGGFDER